MPCFCRDDPSSQASVRSFVEGVTRARGAMLSRVLDAPFLRLHACDILIVSRCAPHPGPSLCSVQLGGGTGEEEQRLCGGGRCADWWQSMKECHATNHHLNTSLTQSGNMLGTASSAASYCSGPSCAVVRETALRQAMLQREDAILLQWRVQLNKVLSRGAFQISASHTSSCEDQQGCQNVHSRLHMNLQW